VIKHDLTHARHDPVHCPYPACSVAQEGGARNSKPTWYMTTAMASVSSSRARNHWGADDLILCEVMAGPWLALPDPADRGRSHLAIP
jgi:hypothetical protein